MSAVILLAPVIIASWPVLASAVVAAAAAAGFRVVKEKEPQKKAALQSVQLSMENSEVVADSMSPDQQIVVERQGVRVIFSRDARGQFRTCVEGDVDKDRLREIGEELSGQVIQQYVYRRLSQELGQSGFSTVGEERTPDGSIRLHVRRYEG
jgi:predicted naringenin-chalcone synthase